MTGRVGPVGQMGQSGDEADSPAFETRLGNLATAPTRPIRFFVALVLAAGLVAASGPLTAQGARTELLRNPDAPEVNRQAPERFAVHLETSKGPIVLAVTRAWAPHGADRFYNLVRAGYYDDTRFHRVVADRWAQFGINGDPTIATAWRDRRIPDDPRVESNVKGTIAFAFAVPNGRTTQVFINLRDNQETHDKEPFVPFGRVSQGMNVVDALNAEYGETSGGGIRAGKQVPLFEGGNAYLDRHFPRLDRLVRATIRVP